MNSDASVVGEHARGVGVCSLDLRSLEILLARIEEKYHPEQVWLFGSRARGSAQPSSDWDLFVVVPDETDEHELDPLVAWRLQRGSGVRADVIPCRATDFRASCDTVNTLAYIVAHEGVPMSAELLIANTLRVAHEDLEGAKALAQLGNRNAAYLCEQAAEKLIRAVLTAEAKHAGIGHRLDDMVDLVPDENPLEPALREIEELAAYATTFRYVTAAGRIPTSISRPKLDEHMARVAAALEATSRHFGVALDQPGTPPRSSKPIR